MVTKSQQEKDYQSQIVDNKMIKNMDDDKKRHKPK